MDPISRRDFIRRLKVLGFDGPFVGGRHEIMVRGGTSVIVPNPHRSDISGPLVADILRRAGISGEEWERAE